jgi:hypothetical protein
MQAIDVQMYTGAVPHFVHEPLDRLYRHLHASQAYHAIYGNLSNETRTCVLKRGDDAIAVILFRIEGDRVRVINEQCVFPQEAIDAFSDYLFTHFPSISLVSFPVIGQVPAILHRPFLHAKCTHDIVLTLPDSVDDYMANLGKSTRTYIKRYFNKIKRCFPSVAWTTCEGRDINEAHVRVIIELNHARMAEKYKDSYIDDAETERILRLVRECGLVTVMTIGGQVCAGTINYRVADNYFLQVVAHAPAYDDYGLGTLCCYLTICECIARKGSEYHFLWGRYEYKYRLLGVQRDLSHLLIYRSRLQMLRNGKTTLRHLYGAQMYVLRDWMEHSARRLDESSVLGQAAFHFLNSIKKVKRAIDRFRKQHRPPLQRISEVLLEKAVPPAGKGTMQ